MRSTYDAQHNEYCAYVLSEEETPFGLTLGNYKTFASSTPKGGIRALWDADTDQIIFGTHQIAYRVGANTTKFPHQIRREFTFLPHAQLSEFTLDDGIAVTETFFVPHGPVYERSVAFVVEIHLHNSGAHDQEVVVFPWAMLIGQRFYGDLEPSVGASVEGTSIRAVNSATGAARWWGSNRAPDTAVIAIRESTLLHGMRTGTLANQGHLHEVSPELAEHVSHRVFGAFEYRVKVAAQARESLRIAVVFHREGNKVARPALEALLHDDGALNATKRAYALRLADARFMTPSPAISRAVVWAKVNMMRVVKEYPKGWGSTNSPPSDILVSRDTSWFVHGYDYLWPEFSRDAIELFNDHLEESGQVVEYVRGVTGFKTSYGLDINDDTPLHLIAMLHYFNSTHDANWVLERIEIIKRVADYLLSQRDHNGLVFCKAGGVDMFGITSWRNIIPSYTLDGAVTEINAEAVFALRAAARLCEVAGDATLQARYAHEATVMQERMMALLFDRDTVGFVLNYDQHENYQDSFTADAIFPVLFEIAELPERRSILARLSEDDFATAVGLRTISTADSWYAPSHGFGLLGGVWPDLTLWFTVALAKNGFVREAAHWLEVLATTMEAGTSRNTVPGQFAEWYDGGSLVNRGMYLSPWTGAKYLWAVAETVCGLDGYRLVDQAEVAPMMPDSWQWTAVARMRRRGKHCSYVIDVTRKTVFTDRDDLTAKAPYTVAYIGREVSDRCEISPSEVALVAFEHDQGQVRAFLGNLNDRERNVIVTFEGRTQSIMLGIGALGELVFQRAGALMSER